MNMNYTKKIKCKFDRAKRKLFTKIYKLNQKKEIERLGNENDPVLKSFANVINSVLNNKINDEEKEIIYKIEELRNILNNSTSTISIIDYGAGSPNNNLTKEEMYEGKNEIKNVGEFCHSVSKSYKWNLLLFKLIREFKPLLCLELGTACGFSAAYQAAALELNHKGKIITMEGSESLSLLAKNNFENLNLKKVEVVTGRFRDTLSNTLCKNQPFDLIFIDGHHDKNATIDYFEKILKNLNDDAILIFDDISWSLGMKEAWTIIKNNKNLKASIDLFEIGICVFTKLPTEKTKYYKITI
ncbi:class I SAM-dependent methyltransferase [Candidatus Parcubacteria bacterium]|nr:class I SAM-dependent methyltransferase [Candidatus Parcubacteria bacterium]